MTTAPLSANHQEFSLRQHAVSMQMLSAAATPRSRRRSLVPRGAAGGFRTRCFIPGREDLTSRRRRPIRRAPSARPSLPAGSVLVIGTRRHARRVGRHLALAKVRGVAGVLSGWRSAARRWSASSTSRFCTAAAPPSMNHLHPVEVQTPVGICGVAVYPGDVIVADEDGAIVVPRHLADEVARDLQQERLRSSSYPHPARRTSRSPAYPTLTAETRALYRAAWVKAEEGNRPTAGSMLAGSVPERPSGAFTHSPFNRIPACGANHRIRLAPCSCASRWREQPIDTRA